MPKDQPATEETLQVVLGVLNEILATVIAILKKLS